MRIFRRFTEDKLYLNKFTISIIIISLLIMLSFFISKVILDSYRSYSINLAALHYEKIPILCRNKVKITNIQYIWGGYLRKVPLFHPYIENNSQGFISWVVEFESTDINMHENRNNLDNARLKKLITIAEEDTFSYRCYFAPIQKDITFDTVSYTLIPGRKTRSYYDILPEAKSILIGSFNNFLPEYIVLYFSMDPLAVKVKSSAWGLEASYERVSSVQKLNGLIYKILYIKDTIKGTIKNTKDTIYRWRHVNISIKSKVTKLPFGNSGILEKVRFFKDSIFKSHRSNVIVAPYSTVKNAQHLKNVRVKNLEVYKLWIMIVKNSTFTTDTSSQIFRYFFDNIKIAFQFGASTDEGEDNIILWNCCNIYSNFEKCIDNYNYKGILRTIPPDLIPKIYIPVKGDMYKPILNHLQKHFILVNSEDKADIVIKSILLDRKIDERVNASRVAEFVGFSMDSFLKKRMEELEKKLEKKCENLGVYPIAIERMYLVTDDTLANKLLDFNIFQGFTGLWWKCRNITGGRKQ